MAKYLIVEKYHNTIYVYIEKGNHHKAMEEHRSPVCRLSESALENECAMSEYLNGAYFVFELKEKTCDKNKAIKKPQGKVSKKKARRKQAR